MSLREFRCDKIENVKSPIWQLITVNKAFLVLVIFTVRKALSGCEVFCCSLFSLCLNPVLIMCLCHRWKCTKNNRKCPVSAQFLPKKRWGDKPFQKAPLPVDSLERYYNKWSFNLIHFSKKKNAKKLETTSFGLVSSEMGLFMWWNR